MEISLQHCVVTNMASFHQFPVTFTYSFVTCSIVLFFKQDAQVSAVASFDDSRCAGQMVRPNDPLLFTGTVTESTSTAARLTLPSRERVQVTSTNMTEVVGATPLPDGVTVQSHNAIVDTLANYTLILAINRASLLGGNPVICGTALHLILTEASCPVVTGIYSISM